MKTNSVDAIVGRKADIIKLLNGLLKKENFFDKAAWEGRTVDAHAVELIAGGAEKQQRVWANRAALEAAFPGLVAPPPALSE